MEAPLTPGHSRGPAPPDHLDIVPYGEAGRLAAGAADIERIALLRFPLIFLLTFIHSATGTVPVGAVSLPLHNPYIEAIVSFLIVGLSRPAVFFFLSGYLFFRTFEPTVRCYRAKMASRLHTLVVPYLFWNLTLFAALIAASQAPGLQKYFSWQMQLQLSPAGLPGALGIGQSMPIAYQFWFLRDLILLGVLAPVVFLAVHRLPLVTLPALLGLFVLVPDLPSAAGSAAFFCAGAHVALNRTSVFEIDRFGPAILAAFIVLKAGAHLIGEPYLSGVASRAAIVASVGALLYLTRFVVRRETLRAALLYLGGFSFLLFAIHEPLLTILRKLVYAAFTVGTEAGLVIYLTLPVAVVAIAWTVQTLLARVAPGFLRVVTGGRCAV